MRLLPTLLLALICASSALTAANRPNVLWITCEDTGPQLGCYGDTYSVTPNLDALARKSCLYRHCWSNAPVCAPARTTIITGMYPTSLGAEHMRSMVKMPEGFKLYPEYLRAAGYYCTNNSKTDYNVEAPRNLWDESSNKAHWKNRKEGQPFFAIFNHTITHESQIRNAIDKADQIHDPAKVRVRDYHPDTPEVRKDWAQYYDRITMMDKLAGANLRELEAAGIADNTIVFFYGDHGSGMPRSKRWPYNSGLHVPLIVHIPEKWKALATPDFKTGGETERLVSFVDLAPTLLSLCGVDIPQHFQGTAFLGPKAGEPRQYVFGFRGRMDERIDMVRSVTDGRYVYIRNFMPHLPYGQHVSYMFQTPTTQVWKRLFDEGKLNEAQSHFWKEKPAEELYDLSSDRDEVRNIARSLDSQEPLQTLRAALDRHLVQTVDLGLVPEPELVQDPSRAPHDIFRDPNRYNVANTLAFARRVTDVRGFPEVTFQGLSPDAATSYRYWAVMDCLIRGQVGGLDRRHSLHDALKDESPAVRVVAAEALCRFGTDADFVGALPVLLDCANAEKHGAMTAVAALNAIDRLGDKAASIKDDIAKLPQKDRTSDARYQSYVPRLIETITGPAP
jgi:arylsulfatase A-like enzyme